VAIRRGWVGDPSRVRSGRRADFGPTRAGEWLDGLDYPLVNALDAGFSNLTSNEVNLLLTPRTCRRGSCFTGGSTRCGDVNKRIFTVFTDLAVRRLDADPGYRAIQACPVWVRCWPQY
jgi:hypothetical protein